MIPAHIDHGHGLITLVTGTFLHAGWLHIRGNMVFLWAFGPALEDAMGRVRYAVFYLIGGVVAMLAQVAGRPGSHVPCLGASGAIAAVMGAFIVMFPRDRIRSLLWILIIIRITYIPAALLIGVWFLIQLWNAGAVARCAIGRRGVSRARGGISVWSGDGAAVGAKGGFQLLAFSYRLSRLGLERKKSGKTIVKSRYSVRMPPSNFEQRVQKRLASSLKLRHYSMAFSAVWLDFAHRSLARR